MSSSAIDNEALVKSSTPPVPPPQDIKFTYATIMETNGEECESWLYFIRYQGNEEALTHLKKQLEAIEMFIIDDLSTFDIELETLVSERTAKEMTKLELNSVSFHRKFDGKMQMIHFGIKKKDSNDRRIERVNKTLGMGAIGDFVEDEDIDPEDLASDDESDSEDEELIALPVLSSGITAPPAIPIPTVAKKRQGKKKKGKKNR